MEEIKLAQKYGIKHIGIIMDGNGRWAKKRHLPRKAGHSQGAKVFKQCVDYCIELGVPCVTFYAFSTENWSRPQDEVDALMKLFEKYLDDIRSMDDKNLQIRFIGDIGALSENLKAKIADTETETSNNNGMLLNIAINYGGKSEVLAAAKKLAMLYKEGTVDLQRFSEADFSELLYTKGQPDVDMIIRPSGEMRTSNFLIWQAAYAEFISMDILWPDFKKDDLIWAIEEYGKRSRRFGGV